MTNSLEYDCHYCGVALTNENVTIDHVLPRALGGVDLRWNKTLSCRTCNEKKADTFPTCDCNFCRRTRRRHWELYRISETHNKRTKKLQELALQSLYA